MFGAADQNTTVPVRGGGDRPLRGWCFLLRLALLISLLAHRQLGAEAESECGALTTPPALLEELFGMPEISRLRGGPVVGAATALGESLLDVTGVEGADNIIFIDGEIVDPAEFVGDI